MNDTRLRFHCEYSPYADSYSLHVGAGRPLTAVAKPLEFEPHEPGTICPDNPTLRLQIEDAQQLIDTLWSAGLRPTQGKQSEGVTAAQEKHLQDMRTIAFAKLKVDRP